MHYSSGLEYIVGSSYSNNSYSKINYFSKNVENQRFIENFNFRVCSEISDFRHLSMIENRFAIYRHVDDNYGFKSSESIIFEPQYTKKTSIIQYKNQQKYSTNYVAEHSFTPELFLKPSRPKTRFVVDNDEAIDIAEETFELMMKEKLPSNISVSILPFEEFKALHSRFGAWNNVILGFSINGDDKKIVIRENYLDALMLVVGHEIGHVLTETLPNKHDEEAKAFAFSIEWAKTLKEHNIADLGINIKDEIEFQPARNGLHDIAFGFVDFLVKRGRKAIELHSDLVRKYISVFNTLYHPK